MDYIFTSVEDTPLVKVISLKGRTDGWTNAETDTSTQPKIYPPLAAGGYYDIQAAKPEKPKIYPPLTAGGYYDIQAAKPEKPRGDAGWIRWHSPLDTARTRYLSVPHRIPCLHFRKERNIMFYWHREPVTNLKLLSNAETDTSTQPKIYPPLAAGGYYDIQAAKPEKPKIYPPLTAGGYYDIQAAKPEKPRGDAGWIRWHSPLDTARTRYLSVPHRIPCLHFRKERNIMFYWHREPVTNLKLLRNMFSTHALGRCPNVELMLVHRMRRWSSIKTILAQCLIFTERDPLITGNNEIL